MKSLLKRTIDFHIKKKRLKIIDKECDKAHIMNIKLQGQYYLVNRLVEEYERDYHEKLR